MPSVYQSMSIYDNQSGVEAVIQTSFMERSIISKMTELPLHILVSALIMTSADGGYDYLLIALKTLLIKKKNHTDH